VAIRTIFSRNDVSRALAVLAEAEQGGDGELAFGRPVVEQLLLLIPADHAGYFEYDFDAKRSRSIEVPAVEPSVARATLEAYCHWMPLRDKRFSQSSTPLKTSDISTLRELRRNPFYALVLRPEGIEHELKVWLPAPPRTAYGFFFERMPGRRDFDERERGLLAMLRPHLAAIRARRRDAHRGALTERETEILRLVARGLTNAEIAGRLVISRATVRTHLEHVFVKLGVHTRTGAVARAFG
jgi:DNA-binding CsgD family transcriptional regulator